MGDKTGISWTDATWNPIRGCTRVSEGCRHCYAETVAARFSGPGLPYEGLAKRVGGEARWTGKIKVVDHLMDQPIRWIRPRRIFVNSMSDLFHDGVSNAVRDRIFRVMEIAHWHTFQVLTKRPGAMRDYIKSRFAPGSREVLQNVHLGVSVEDQPAADERIPLLRDTPAAVRFLSGEPLLGPVWQDMRGIDWVIVGGESGRGARPMHPEWARLIRNQCQDAGVPFFFKQWGEWRPICEGPGDWFDGLYRPNRKAREGEDQDALNETYGRRCTVPKVVIDRDGKVFTDVASFGAYQQGAGVMLTFQVGAKAAGAMLDGREWQKFPKEREAI